MDLSVVFFLRSIGLLFYSKLKLRVIILDVSLDRASENLLLAGLNPTRSLPGTNMLPNPMEYFNSGASLKNEK